MRGVLGRSLWFVLLQPYQKQRVLTFLNPTSDLAGAGYHQHQSLIAVGSGEWSGKGHGQGTQTQLSFLPEQQTDFIFSVWAEEHGFVGSLLVVVLFAALMLLLLRMALRARDRFGALLIVGVTALLFWHSVINMLMVLRLAPVVGVPLPFWSNGGSFLLTAMLGLGLAVSVDRRRNLF
ncbi:MAG: FtsW/RodA/SpoVE family cell cycle protein [Myxococcales bacterium]|nr:FtsW/RodA/SpoVE family cell cycle protein [Myxococcales bacterium]